MHLSPHFATRHDNDWGGLTEHEDSMADGEHVDGAGWVSDDSSFYGDEETVAWWETRARRQLDVPSPYVARSPIKKRKTPEVAGNGHDSTQVYKTTVSSSSAKDERNVLDFLNSRPQIASLQNNRDERTKKIKTDARTLTGKEASELVDVDHFKGCEEAWQHDESINDFLKRVPVAHPDTARVGPWLWVSCPKIARSRQDRKKQINVDAFIDLGEDLKMPSSSDDRGLRPKIQERRLRR